MENFFSQSSTKTIPFRSFAFSFNYSLGKLKFKQIKTNIKNDDIQNDSVNEFLNLSHFCLPKLFLHFF